MQINLFKISASLLIVGALSLNVANAHKGATGIIKERMDTMSDMGKSIGILIDMIKGKTTYDAVIASDAASALQNHTNTMANQYPDTVESRENKFTQAMPSVWTDRVKFEELVDALSREVSTLNKIAANKDFKLLRPQIAQVAKSCSACHEKFRKPK